MGEARVTSPPLQCAVLRPHSIHEIRPARTNWRLRTTDWRLPSTAPRLRLRIPFGAMAQEFLVVRGAREHNLKNISVAIPRNRLTVITGLSGSGKSSLAFDTIYAEGQRRYVESLSAYARQFLGLM